MNEIRFKFLSDSVLKAFAKDGRKYCRLTASSNAEDLVGDVMLQKALEQMKTAAVGTALPFSILDFRFAIERKSSSVVNSTNPKQVCRQFTSSLHSHLQVRKRRSAPA